MLIKVWVTVRLREFALTREALVNIPDIELEELSEPEQNKLCEDYAINKVAEMHEWGWSFHKENKDVC